MAQTPLTPIDFTLVEFDLPDQFECHDYPDTSIQQSRPNIQAQSPHSYQHPYQTGPHEADSDPAPISFHGHGLASPVSDVLSARANSITDTTPSCTCSVIKPQREDLCVPVPDVRPGDEDNLVHRSWQQLFHLCAELAGDCPAVTELLHTSPDPSSSYCYKDGQIDNAVQTVLSWTSRLNGILERVVRTFRNDSDGTATRSSNGSDHPNLLGTATMVTAYILLCRAWRHLFCHLHHLLLANNQASRTGQPSHRRHLKLLNLQLAGFPIQTTSDTTQITIILELAADGIGKLETCLGVSLPSTGSRGRAGNGNGMIAQQEGSDSRDQDLGGGAGKVRFIDTDPVSVLIRESLISREHLHHKMMAARAATSSHGGNVDYSTWSLPEIMDRIRGLLRTP